MPTLVLMPQMGESIAEGTLVRWLKKPGDTVERDEPLFEISTDKVDAEIPSPTSGILTAINVKEGETATVNSVVAVIGQEGEAVAPDRHTAPAAAASAAPAPAAAASAPAPAPPRPQTGTGGEDVRSSPVVRRLAREHNVDISRIAGTGQNGRVTKADLLEYVESRPAGAKQEAPAAYPVAIMPGDRTEPLGVMRKKIAEHMILSRRTSAHVHTVFHVNFSRVEKIRDATKAAYEQAGAKLTFMAFIAKAALDAIRRHPVLNASLDGDTVVYHRDVNLGIAVALENGLIVPVIKRADEKNMLGLTRAIADVAQRARSKKLSPEEVQGGTFTITNPGQYGAQFGLPIINQPQVAILGIGAIEPRAIVIDDALAIRTMSYLTLGFDHRLIDGVVADAFMADIKKGIEEFDAAEV